MPASQREPERREIGTGPWPHETRPGPLSAMERIERSANRVARLEQMRSGYQESMIRRESRRAAAELSEHDSEVTAEQAAATREGAELEAWIVDEAVFMLREGWTPEQLVEFGFAPAVLERAALRVESPE